MSTVKQLLQPFVDKIIRPDYTSLYVQEAFDYIKPIMKSWLQRTDWLHDDFFQCKSDEEKIFKLHQDENDGLMIVAISWGCDFSPIPHNHNAWAIAGVAHGIEKHVFYKREKQGEKVMLKEIGTRDYSSGDIVCMKDDVIHSVANVTENDGVAVSLHVYEKNLDNIERSQFDLENHVELPYKLDYVI